MTPKIIMYLTARCPYCVRAERLLAAHGVVDIFRIRIDLEPQKRIEMIQKSGRRTVPQIYVGDFHVGGYEELAELDQAGRLQPLLQGEPAQADRTGT